MAGASFSPHVFAFEFAEYFCHAAAYLAELVSNIDYRLVYLHDTPEVRRRCFQHYVAAGSVYCILQLFHLLRAVADRGQYSVEVLVFLVNAPYRADGKLPRVNYFCAVFLRRYHSRPVVHSAVRQRWAVFNDYRPLALYAWNIFRGNLQRAVYCLCTRIELARMPLDKLYVAFLSRIDFSDYYYISHHEIRFAGIVRYLVSRPVRIGYCYKEVGLIERKIIITAVP